MNLKLKPAELLVLASQGRWETILQLLQAAGQSRIITTVAVAFEARGDRRALDDRAAAVRYFHIAFWCRWVLVDRARSLEQRAGRGIDMTRVKQKLDAAMASGHVGEEPAQESPVRRIVELVRRECWDEAEELYALLRAQSDPYGDVAATAGAGFEEAAGEAHSDLKLWLYRKSRECFERFTAMPAATKEEAQARAGLVERVKVSLAAFAASDE